MLTRFSTKCAETGKRINKGEHIYLDIKLTGNKAYSYESNRYTQERNAISEQEYNVYMHNCYYQRLYSNF